MTKKEGLRVDYERLYVLDDGCCISLQPLMLMLIEIEQAGPDDQPRHRKQDGRDGILLLAGQLPAANG